MTLHAGSSHYWLCVTNTSSQNIQTEFWGPVPPTALFSNIERSSCALRTSMELASKLPVLGRMAHGAAAGAKFDFFAKTVLRSRRNWKYGIKVIQLMWNTSMTSNTNACILPQLMSRGFPYLHGLQVSPWFGAMWEHFPQQGAKAPHHTLGREDVRHEHFRRCPEQCPHRVKEFSRYGMSKFMTPVALFAWSVITAVVHVFLWLAKTNRFRSQFIHFSTLLGLSRDDQ